MNSVLSLTPAQRAQLFQAAAQKMGLADVILEKDFWVCWALNELFSLPGIGEHLIFKGGTSLSKVWRVIERFSEDIDISLSREWLGFSGASDPEHATTGKKQREKLTELSSACAAKVGNEILTALRDRATAALGPEGWSIAVDAGEAQTLLFRYPTVLSTDAAAGYIRREVKIECGARSDAWPAEKKIIQPYVAEAVDTIKDCDVTVQVLAAERTFWEKATILHAEAHREKDKGTPARYSRHYADLAALSATAIAGAAIARKDLRERVVEHKQVFFASAWAHYETAVPGTFRLVPEAYRLEALAADYRDMREMFFRDPIDWREVVERLQRLEADINRSA